MTQHQLIIKNRTIVRELRELGFEGTIYFRKPNEFGTSDNYGPAIHQRINIQDRERELSNVMDAVQRDNFETVVLYVERPRKSKAYPYATLKVFTKSQINGLTKSLSMVRFSRHEDRNNESIHARAESYGLEYDYNNYEVNGDVLAFKAPRKITKDQTELGKAWLKNHFFKRDGSPRKGKNTQGVNDRVLTVAKTATRFEFVGVLALMNSFGNYVQFLPIYRTYGKRGGYFDYAPIHWGQPVIMEGN